MPDIRRQGAQTICAALGFFASYGLLILEILMAMVPLHHNEQLRGIPFLEHTHKVHKMELILNMEIIAEAALGNGYRFLSQRVAWHRLGSPTLNQDEALAVVFVLVFGYGGERISRWNSRFWALSWNINRYRQTHHCDCD
ncbi:unnamed protein product [Ilex paraguariensis]|uniref:Uncharacterized protein n=1 Tax=Ilex paraguariensis TaxID=185542 RepID=A0ABC8QPS4_9AQUA